MYINNLPENVPKFKFRMMWNLDITRSFMFIVMLVNYVHSYVGDFQFSQQFKGVKLKALFVDILCQRHKCTPLK